MSHVISPFESAPLRLTEGEFVEELLIFWPDHSEFWSTSPWFAMHTLEKLITIATRRIYSFNHSLRLCGIDLQQLIIKLSFPLSTSTTFLRLFLSNRITHNCIFACSRASRPIPCFSFSCIVQSGWYCIVWLVLYSAVWLLLYIAVWLVLYSLVGAV